MLEHMRPTLYEFAGGSEAFLALAAAHHARCLADPELNHPFSHPDQNPKHVERLAAYWAQVMGGPPAYTAEWGGDESFLVAMHAGNLPGYPASAGCVRLPVDFAAKLYSVTTIGTTVIIADPNSAPKETVKPGLLFSRNTGTAFGGFKWTPEKAPTGPVSIIISGADRAAYVYRNGVEIGRTPTSGVERLAGTYVFTALESVDASGRREWISTASSGRRVPNLKELAKRVRFPAEFDDDIRSVITPGTTLVITNLPVSTRTHSAPGFSILTD